MPDLPPQSGLAADGSSHAESLGARIERQRARLFVGRDAERARFQRLIEGESDARILAVSGPAGIGKSLLTRRLLATAQQRRIHAVSLDAQLLQEATPQSLEASVVEIAATFDPSALINVLCIDNVERIAAMKNWLRGGLLTLLPANTLLILAGRWQPPTAWRADPALGSLLEHWELTPLSAGEVADYLTRRGLSAAQRTAVSEFAQGHPLAVALTADHLLRTGEQTLRPDKSGDLIQRLIAWLLSDTRNTRYRECLEAAATLHFVNEPILQVLIPRGDAGALYQWLARQPYMEHRSQGLLMHELVRRVVIEDLRRRNLPRHHRLIRRAVNFYMDDLEHRPPEAVHFSLAETTYAVRWEPHMLQYYDMSQQTHYLDEARSHELETLADIVEELHGGKERQRFLYWYKRQPDLLYVVRDDAGRPVGLMLGITLGKSDMQVEQTDPAADRYLRFLKQHAPLEQDEKALLLRFVMVADTYQQTGPAFTQLAMKGNSLNFLPGLTHSAAVCDPTKDWSSSTENANLNALPGCRIKTDHRELEIRGYDLKAEPPLIWVRNTVERMLNIRTAETPSAPITQQRFADAVIDALHHFHDDERLTGNALLASRLLNRCTDHHRPAIAELRKLIAEALENINRRCPNKHFPEIIEHSYFRDDSKQIAAAAALSISESTYRRRLRQAETAIIEQLWAQEINPSQR